MSQFKLRGWDKFERKMYYFDLLEYMSYHEMAQEEECSYGARKNLMRHTGLQDDTGKEIFEGDVINDKKNLKGKVFFKNGSFRVTSTYNGINDENYYDLMDLDLIKDNNIVVIGNIYEDPELIK